MTEAQMTNDEGMVAAVRQNQRAVIPCQGAAFSRPPTTLNGDLEIAAPCFSLTNA
jgi:hypothetical protein